MAPEVYYGKKYDSTVDLYSLGLVLYNLMNGYCKPFLDQDDKSNPDKGVEAFNKRMDGAELPPPVNASKEFSDIILKACAYEPHERYKNAAQMLDALRKLQQKHMDESASADTDSAAAEQKDLSFRTAISNVFIVRNVKDHYEFISVQAPWLDAKDGWCSVAVSEAAFMRWNRGRREGGPFLVTLKPIQRISYYGKDGRYHDEQAEGTKLMEAAQISPKTPPVIKNGNNPTWHTYAMNEEQFRKSLHYHNLDKASFFLTEEQSRGFSSCEDLTRSQLAKKLNELRDEAAVGAITVNELTQELEKRQLLETVRTDNGSRKPSITPKGREFGLSMEDRTSESGEQYSILMLTPAAQNSVLRWYVKS